jgi:hypothetical protein
VAKEKSGVPDDVLRFNAFIADEKQAEREQRKIAQADKAKQRAAEDVRRLNADANATRDERAAVEQRYHEAVADWRRARGDDAPPDPSEADIKAEEAVAAQGADDTEVDDPETADTDD